MNSLTSWTGSGRELQAFFSRIKFELWAAGKNVYRHLAAMSSTPATRWCCETEWQLRVRHGHGQRPWWEGNSSVGGFNVRSILSLTSVSTLPSQLLTATNRNEDLEHGPPSNPLFTINTGAKPGALWMLEISALLLSYNPSLFLPPSEKCILFRNYPLTFWWTIE